MSHLSPERAVEEAVQGLVADVQRHTEALEQKFDQKLQKHQERFAMLSRHSQTRPLMSACVQEEAPHQKAMQSYLRNGNDEGFRGLTLEGKSMNTAVSAEGGYLVDPMTADTVKSVLSSSASLRAVASVVQVEASSFDVLVDRGEMGHGWATEASGVTETDTPVLERISIPLHELSALPKASQRLLDDSAFDVEGWLAGRIAAKFSRAEASAFINGDGVDKPKGFLTHPMVEEELWEWGNLGFVITGEAGDFPVTNQADCIVDLIYALAAEYRSNASFVMNSKTAGALRKLKDSDGRFLWSDGMGASEPSRLMGYPVMICEDMPDIDEDAAAIAFGDFNAGYTIAERPDLRILRDPFSAKPHVLFYATKRVGGDVSDFAAIKLLKFSAV